MRGRRIVPSVTEETKKDEVKPRKSSPPSSLPPSFGTSHRLVRHVLPKHEAVHIVRVFHGPPWNILRAHGAEGGRGRGREGRRGGVREVIGSQYFPTPWSCPPPFHSPSSSPPSVPPSPPPSVPPSPPAHLDLHVGTHVQIVAVLHICKTHAGQMSNPPSFPPSPPLSLPPSDLTWIQTLHHQLRELRERRHPPGFARPRKVGAVLCRENDKTPTASETDAERGGGEGVRKVHHGTLSFARLIPSPTRRKYRTATRREVGHREGGRACAETGRRRGRERAEKEGWDKGRRRGEMQRFLPPSLLPSLPPSLAHLHQLLDHCAPACVTLLPQPKFLPARPLPRRRRQRERQSFLEDGEGRGRGREGRRGRGIW
jgi:hypothetical protein